MIVGIFQFEPLFGQVDHNLKKIEQAAQKHDFDLLVLPELCTTGYQFVSHEEVGSLAEPVPGGETVARLTRLAQDKNAHIVVGLAEKEGEKIYNTAVLIGPEGVVGKYRKLHLFDEEKLFFTHGNLGLPVFEVAGTTVGLLVCFDWIFPEAARTLALKGAELICQPANLVLPYCQDAMVTRAIENRLFTITANRVGSEARGGKPRLHFTGKSQVVTPRGERILAFSEKEEHLRVVEIDPTQARDKWVTPRNHLFEERRPDVYEL